MSESWAIIGNGFIASKHVEGIKHIGDRILQVCDEDLQKDTIGGIFAMNWRTMIESPYFMDIDCVAICTPNYLHYEMCDMFSDMGKRVLCEKPLVLDSSHKLPDSVFTVLQLRHHPEVKKLKKKLPEGNVKLYVKVKRDKDYFNGWKFNNKLSGGILFNLGIHYFDLLIYLFGDEYKVLGHTTTDKIANGLLDFKGRQIEYEIELQSTDNRQDRYLQIGDKRISFSKQDNLSFENLHNKVYEDFKKGKGITFDEAVKSIKLVEKLL